MTEIYLLLLIAAGGVCLFLLFCVRAYASLSQKVALGKYGMIVLMIGGIWQLVDAILSGSWIGGRIILGSMVLLYRAVHIPGQGIPGLSTIRYQEWVYLLAGSGGIRIVVFLAPVVGPTIYLYAVITMLSVITVAYMIKKHGVHLFLHDIGVWILVGMLAILSGWVYLG